MTNLVKVLVIGSIFSFLAPLAIARPGEAISEQAAVHAVLGEARGEGYRGMYAVACALRNRGRLRGVDGAFADVSDASPQLHQLAAKAWAESEDGEDITHGADHWFSGKNYPYWARGHRPTAIIGHHRFYKVK
jgi:spore germination cell wall hydrolase CwlJ-like protein